LLAQVEGALDAGIAANLPTILNHPLDYRTREKGEQTGGESRRYTRERAGFNSKD
jgi:hypothetical protein